MRTLRTDTSNIQANWFALIDREGSEQAARRYLATWLRQAAEQVERGTLPDVYGCKLPEYGYTGSLGMGEFSVTFMWPVGG